MDIYKIALLGIISAILIMALKDQVPVFTVVISIITGILIILYILPQIKEMWSGSAALQSDILAVAPEVVGGIQGKMICNCRN